MSGTASPEEQEDDFDADDALPSGLWDPETGIVAGGVNHSDLRSGELMVVLVLERVPPGLRGELTRLMLEIRSGVFVGTLTSVVRDRLWRKACQEMAGDWK